MDTGLFLLRVAVGVALLAQGVGKLRPANRAGAAGYFGGLGFEPARLSAFMAGAGEAVAGTLFLLGLLTPLGAAAAAGVLVAAVAVSGANGWSATKGGAEYPVVLLGAVAALAITGAGEWSLDHATGIDPGVGEGIAGLAAGTAASLVLLARRAGVLRRRPHAVDSPSEVAA